MPNEELRQALRDYLLREVIRDTGYSLDDDAPLISSGLIDSFSLVDLALWVEDRFGVHIDNTDLNADNFDSVAELAMYIEGRLG